MTAASNARPVESRPGDPVITPAMVAEHGITEFEYARLLAMLGRTPTFTELGIVSALWSEHCSYKHSRPMLKTLPTKAPWVLQGPGENAGVISVGDGWAIAFKIESHNHPSAIEPYQGAATGVGGILRDVFTMGARPIALLNSLRFGPLTSSRVRWLFAGVVKGIGDYGNCVGVPTVGGEVVFDPSYEGNPLVNAMCVGLMREDELITAAASGVGNPIMAVGARTGRDGIHGASFASEDLSASSEAKRPMVQVARAPFSRDTWTHAVFTLDKINDKSAKPTGRLWLNGKLQGAIENWDLTFDWKGDAVNLVLGAAYVGHLDDLAVFDRALTDAEVKQLMALKNGVRDLRP